MSVDVERLLLRSGMLAALVDSSPVAILVLDLDKNVTMWNPACERMFGWTEAELLGKPYPLVPEGEWAQGIGLAGPHLDFRLGTPCHLALSNPFLMFAHTRIRSPRTQYPLQAGFLPGDDRHAAVARAR